MSEGELKVMFLKKANNLYIADATDEKYVSFDQVIRVLPAPDMIKKGGRIFYKF